MAELNLNNFSEMEFLFRCLIAEDCHVLARISLARNDYRYVSEY